MKAISTRTLQLHDVRLLEYATYGADDGLPALFFHGFIGSHHQAAFVHEAARRHGLRLIAPNRPGVGRSSPKDRHQLDECVPDMEQLLDSLAITRFGVIGVSGGAPYALACPKGLPARRGGEALSGGTLHGAGARRRGGPTDSGGAWFGEWRRSFRWLLGGRTGPLDLPGCGGYQRSPPYRHNLE
jgi:hypothetical protein